MVAAGETGRGELLGVLVLGLGLGLLAGCPGDLPQARDDSSSAVGGDWQLPPRSDGPVTPPPPPDLKVNPGKPDKVAQPPSPDTRPVLPPDSGVPAGGPCPCPATQFCLDGKCQLRCTPGGPCGVDSACPPTDTCILVVSHNIYLCRAATAAPGGACGDQLWCPTSYLCMGPTSSSTGTCRAQCLTVGAACSTGGTCQLYNTCKVCSK